jgi:Tfp pilus assembly protein PilO
VADFQFNADHKGAKAKLGLLAGGVVLFAGLGWLTWSDWSTLTATREEVAAERLKLDRANQELATTATTEDKVLLLRETVQEYVRILPDDKEINSFVEQLAQFAAESGVRVTKLDDDDAKARNARVKKGPAPAFDKVAYKISAEGGVEQLLRFMDLFENHERFVRVASLKIESKEKSVARAATEDGAGPEAAAAPLAPHQIDLELETYVYNPKTKAQTPVVVPGEAQKLDRLRSANGERADARRDLALASYVRTPRADRRDVFYDPRQPAAGSEASPEVKRAQEAAFAALAEKLKAAQTAAAKEKGETSLIKKLKAAEATDRALAEFDAAFKEAEAAKTITLDDLRKRVETELVPVFAALAKGRDLASRPAALPFEAARDAVARMKAARDARKYDEVSALGEDLKRRRTGQESAEALALFAEAAHLAEDAQAEADFDGRSFQFGGTVVYKDAPDRSVAIINGRPYMPGDRLDDETTVTSISASEVVFEFRGRRVARSVKSAAPAAPEKKAGTKPDRKKKP